MRKPLTKIALAIYIAFLLPIISCDITDSRDGKKYKTVEIRSQTWMAENLNINITGSMCYYNREINCDEYGRLYDWETALKACPAGWHLPSHSEWKELIGIANGVSRFFRAAKGWNKGKIGNGWDTYGFSALPGGIASGSNLNDFLYLGEVGSWWTASESEIDTNQAYRWSMNNDLKPVRWDVIPKYYLLSVRCVQN